MTKSAEPLNSKASNRPSNTPVHSRLDRAKYWTSTMASEMRPHPIKKWKDADSRVKNLFVTAAIAAPGFLALVGGSIQTFQSQQDVDACANQPAATAAPFDICDSASNGRDDGIILAFGGFAGMTIVGGVGVWNDGRLSKRESNGKSSGSRGSTGPKPPTSPEPSFRPTIMR